MKMPLSQTYVDAIKPKDKPFDILDTKTSGLLVRVQPTGVTTYYIAYKLPDGRKTRTILGRVDSIKLKVARDLAVIKLGKVANGAKLNDEKRAMRAAGNRERAAHTVGSYRKEVYGPWLEANRRSGKATRQRLKSVFAEFEKKKLASLNAWVIEKWRSKRLKAGIKPETINRDLTALKAMLSMAVEMGHLDVHPLAKVKQCEVDDDHRVRYLTDEEKKRLTAALPKAPLYLQVMVLLAMNTGARRGEIFGLAWENVNLKSRQITITARTAKGKKTRHVPLNDDALAALEHWKEEATDTDGLVFPGKRGQPMNNIKRSWQTLRDAAKLKDFRFHDFRHEFASKLVMGGIDIYRVSVLLGHSDIKMTKKYAHLSDEHKAEAVAVLCSHG